MKKFFNIAAIVLTVTSAMVSCTKDWEPAPEESSISLEIVKSDVLFEAKADAGTIEVKADGTITAECESDWCTVSVKGTTVNVSVTENGALEGRAVPVIIKCGNESVKATVQQKGILMSLSCGSKVLLGDKASENTYEFKTNVDLKFSTDCDWITVSQTEEGLQISAKENNTGYIRKGTIKYASETYEGSIDVCQCDFEKDIMGQYYFAYTDEDTGEIMAMLAVVKADCIEFPSDGWSLPISKWDPNTMTITCPNAVAIGKYSSYTIAPIVLDNDAGYLSYSTSISFDFKFDVEEEDGLIYQMAPMADNGSWGSYLTTSLYFYAFSSTTISSANKVGYLLCCVNPFLQKM